MTAPMLATFDFGEVAERDAFPEMVGIFEAIAAIVGHEPSNDGKGEGQFI